jgi:uncharacterized protein (TIGR02145 family)
LTSPSELSAITYPPAYRSFAENATDYGAYFRWDDPTQYFYGDKTSVPYVNSPSTTWQSGNDPCPDGWRVPTKAECNALFAAATTKTLGVSGGINGMTYTTTNGSLFFPAAGYRFGAGSYYQTTRGYYWSSTQSSASQAWFLHFDSTIPGDANHANNKLDARNVRCVRPYVVPVVNPVGEVLVEGTYRTVYWAKSNVGTTVKTFESSATAYGGYFLWDDDTPYTYTGGTNPPENSSSATFWQSANNPCPAGWEVPTYQDFVDLLAASTTKTWGPSGTINGVTYTSAKGTLFFPAGGYRNGSASADQTTHGRYWASEPYDATTAYMLYFLSTDPGIAGSGGVKTYARPVRCVRPKIE